MDQQRRGDDEHVLDATVGPAGQVDAVAFLKVSDGLRDAFALLGEAKLRPDESTRWQRRLIAISNVAKRDLTGALEQLERFQHDWAQRRR